MPVKRKSSRANEDVIRNKLLSTKEWRIKVGSIKRNDYENQRKGNIKAKGVHSELNILPFGTGDDLDKITKPKHSANSGLRSAAKQPMTRFSRVFSKSIISPKNQITSLKPKTQVTKKEEIAQLQELAFDKTYFNRVLWDEHVRMIFLRGSNVGQPLLKQKPFLRLWLEALMTNISEKSRSLRHVLKNEIHFLSNRYQVHRQLHFWQTLHSLTLDQLYYKRCQHAFRKRIRQDALTEDIDYIWRWFNHGMYVKVAKAAKPLIIAVKNWPERKANSMKFKFLADLYYARGLSLMHLKKYKTAFKCFRKDGEIGQSSNLKVSIDRSKDNIGRIQAIRGNYRHAIKLWSERLLEVENFKEKAWLCYGIAQCYALEENYEKAIDMSNMCIYNADQVKSYCWELNGNLLLANCSAMIGTMREANVKSNILVSLKAINRAYQCAVFLANVSILRKVVEIVVRIYNSFKDIDLSMLEDIWSPSLMDYARKASIAEAERITETKNQNINNAIKILNKGRSTIKRNNTEGSQLISKDGTNLSNITAKVKETKTTLPCKIISDTIVNVCLDDIELHSICSPKECSKTHISLSFCTSPITAVEVVSSNEFKAESLSDEWVTESEYEDECEKE